MLFIIRSVPLLNDTEEWNPILHEDIADMGLLRNKDSLKLVGWEKRGRHHVYFYQKLPQQARKLKKNSQPETNGHERWRLETWIAALTTQREM